MAKANMFNEPLMYGNYKVIDTNRPLQSCSSPSLIRQTTGTKPQHTHKHPQTITQVKPPKNYHQHYYISGLYYLCVNVWARLLPLHNDKGFPQNGHKKVDYKDLWITPKELT